MQQPRQPRPIEGFISTVPERRDQPHMNYSYAASDTFIWFRLRQLADVREEGEKLFSGTSRERRALYRSFRAYVHSAEVYWDAARATRGAAAALPYYYALLQLAKAELLRFAPSKVEGGPLRHGLSHKRSKGSSIRGDRVSWAQPGVFGLLYESRTGRTLPPGVHPKVMSLLSMIPEIGLEMQTMGLTRPPSATGLYAVASDPSSSWSLLYFPLGVHDWSEPSTRRLMRGYELIESRSLQPPWRTLFSVSTRMYGGGFAMQSKKVHTGTGTVSTMDAKPDLFDVMGDHVSSGVNAGVDFVLTPSLAKSSNFVLPLPLVRYAVMYYLSSLVRYQPTKVDPSTEGAQAYLMDSVVNELPINLLAAALDGITQSTSAWDPSHLRI